jgi:peptide deformylase
MVREIVIWPDPVLKKPSTPVALVDDEVRQLIDDLAETMYAADGVGLAAPQVGISMRVVVIDTSPRQEGQKLLHLVNPEIVKTEGETVFSEGCLSVPGEAEEVERAAKVWVRAIGRDGEPFEVEGEGLLAIALQHEIDHLDGTLIRRRMKKLKEERASETAEEIRGAKEHESAL